MRSKKVKSILQSHLKALERGEIPNLEDIEEILRYLPNLKNVEELKEINSLIEEIVAKAEFLKERLTKEIACLNDKNKALKEYGKSERWSF